MNVREIVIAHIKSIGADGLCCDGCGCGLDDLMPCCGDALECKPAKKHICDGTCSGCCATEDESKSGMHACYRPVNIGINEEETHL